MSAKDELYYLSAPLSAASIADTDTSIPLWGYEVTYRLMRWVIVAYAHAAIDQQGVSQTKVAVL